MIKIIGSIIVILSAGGMGFYYAGELKESLEVMVSLKSVAFMLHGNIKYSNATLPEALSSVAKRHKGRLLHFLECITVKLAEGKGESFIKLWFEAIDETFTNTRLNARDKLCIQKLGESLLHSGRDMQLSGIMQYIEQLEEEIKTIDKELKPKCYLYRSLGILMGLFIVIIVF